MNAICISCKLNKEVWPGSHPLPALWEAFHVREGLHGIQPKLLLLLVTVRAPKGSVHPRPGILQPLREALRLIAGLRRDIGLLHGRDMMRGKSNETLLMDMHMYNKLS